MPILKYLKNEAREITQSSATFFPKDISEKIESVATENEGSTAQGGNCGNLLLHHAFTKIP